MLEQIGDPLRVFLVGFLPLDRLDEFWMADITWQDSSRMLWIGNQYFPVDSMQTSLQ